MKDKNVLFPNYLESIDVEKALHLIEKSPIKLDGVLIKVDSKIDVEPSILLKNIEENVFEIIKHIVGGSGVYDKKKGKGYLFNFGRYYNPCLSIDEMQESRKLHKNDQEKQYF